MSEKTHINENITSYLPRTLNLTPHTYLNGLKCHLIPTLINWFQHFYFWLIDKLHIRDLMSNIRFVDVLIDYIATFLHLGL